VYTIAMTSHKGGVGRTALTALLAWWLMEKEKARVAVVDLDNQGNLTRTLGRHRHELAAAQLFGARVEGAFPGEMCLFPGGVELADLERASPQVIRNFRDNLAQLGPHFDYCLIDTPAAMGLRTIGALVVADSALCPIELDPYCMDAAMATLKTVFGVRQRHNPRLEFLGLLANRFNRRSLGLREALYELLKAYGGHVILAKISMRLIIPEALSKGIPVWRLPRDSAHETEAEIRAAFRLILEKIGTRVQPPAETSGTAPVEDASGQALPSREPIVAGPGEKEPRSVERAQTRALT
jgi:chromosome partitioning protein